MKYIDTCEKYQNDCINTNIKGTLNICYQAKKHNVKNVLTVSTDKANNPSCLYGISKLASERITISHGFSVYQGINFWNSDGSFLQKWRSALKQGKPVILYNKNHIRFFSHIQDTATEILEILNDNNNKINYPKKCFKIKIFDVYNLLKELFTKHEFKIQSSKENEFDKIQEEINEKTQVEILNIEEVKKIVYPCFYFHKTFYHIFF
jgi:FlaA1/EpsC-like NDP-sugar epimerase